MEDKYRDEEQRMKVALVLGICLLGLVHGRPSAVNDYDVEPAFQPRSAVYEPKPKGLMDLLGSETAVITPNKASPKAPSKGPLAPPAPKDPWYVKFANAVNMDLVSLGKVNNDPTSTKIVDGEAYNRLSVSFGDKRQHRISLDHILRTFEEGNPGALGLGVESHIPYVGDISVRAGQGLDNAGNSTFDWRFNYNNQVAPQDAQG